MLTDEYKYLYNNITRIPKQIMNYQIALKMHKLLNEHDDDLSFEQVMVMDQIINTSRQIKFKSWEITTVRLEWILLQINFII